MNSSSAEPDIRSELIDLEAVPFTMLRGLETELLRKSLRHVVERTRHVHARYPSSGQGDGERID
ncbi:MAG TPA: hypothetical protein VH969_21880 [Actinophytocola sp.]|jgi:hypothetical protein|uniref:hypothetical protein n=1 Tax=Actinophytocola sp. TaxID=1872138 RepID=UPI002F928BEC